jgi:hypothetical protein
MPKISAHSRQKSEGDKSRDSSSQHKSGPPQAQIFEWHEGMRAECPEKSRKAKQPTSLLPAFGKNERRRRFDTTPSSF